MNALQSALPAKFRGVIDTPLPRPILNLRFRTKN
jgi:hypothetical protein